MGHKRIEWLDVARGMSIFLVVCAHSIGSVSWTYPKDSLYFNILMSLFFTPIMPCFFAISGYLYKPIKTFHSYRKMFYKKIISLGIPYVLFSIIYVILQNLGGSNVNGKYQFSSLLTIYATPISYIWFLYALFFMFVIVGLFDLIGINKWIQLIIYLGFMSFNIIFSNVFCLGIRLTMNNIIYFYIGYLISNTNICNIIRRKNLNIRSTYILILVFMFLLFIQSFYLIGNATDYSTFSDFLTKLVSILLLIKISMNMSYNNKLFKYFDKYGKLTLIIYLVHAPTVSIARAIIFRIVPINSIDVILLPIILILIGWYISIFVCYLSKRFTIINFIFYQSKQYISRVILKTNFGKHLLN